MIDILLVLLDKRIPFIFTALIMLLLGGSVIALQTAKYKYVVVLETGAYVLPDSSGKLAERKVIEPVTNTKSKLETSIIPKVTLNYGESNQAENLPKFSVSVPEGSNLIQISATATQNNSDLIVTLLNQIAQKVVQEHQKKSIEIQEAVVQWVELVEVEIQSLASKIAQAGRNRKFTIQKLDRLNDKKKLLTEQASRITDEIKSLQKTRAFYLGDNARSKDALALLLIDNEVRESTRQRDEIENAIHISLVNERHELEKKIENQASELELLSAELSRLKDIYKRHAISTDSQNNTNKPLNLAKNIHPTAVVIKPYRESDPLGLGIRKQALILIFVSLFFGSIAAFFMAVLEQKKQ